MIKKFFIGFFLSVSLFGVDVVVMPNGKVAIVNKDGSWEEVTLAKMGDKTIALRKNGTWVVVDKQIKTIKPKIKNEVVEIEKKQPNSSNSLKLSPFAKYLIGDWKGDDREYIFDKNGKMIIKKDGDTIKDFYTIVGYDKNKNIIRVGIGRRFKMGPFSMGGKILKFRFSNDFKKLYDLSELEENYKEIELRKINESMIGSQIN